MQRPSPAPGGSGRRHPPLVGVWILDPALTALDAVLTTEHKRLAGHR
ncbi:MULTISPECIES: hypothetical protein [unclassified Streptomyces]|nr:MULTISPECIES: hypothetical protein [unclassified Streptomyces]MYR67632.1 hypothetical protein [Streptomyces sp. SID4939]MYR98906.1 hypothetical protein [Streptomyces sp. SID4940]MYT62101.1 hypothetical protein [Streptomyces sp. SID8357]MYT68038.1 hypothetical protein [Streptomyces sp. SID8357]MYT86311.1 hypothetical protein [Streptomyces sp. SID8360]